MKHFSLLVLVLVLSSSTLLSQTFTWSPNMSIPDNGPQTCNSKTVSGLSGNLDCNTPFGLESVCIRINHTWDSDLDIYLIAPDGTTVELSTDNGGSGNNYGAGGTRTCFSMSAGTNITAGGAPFTAGPYIPEGDLSLVNNGQNGNGTWRLCITDDAGGDVGTLLSWQLTFGSSPNCPPPPVVQDCNGGTTVCNNQAFSGNSSDYGITQELNGTNQGCLGTEHQSSWYFFEASTGGNIEFTISPTSASDDYDFAVWGPYPSGSTPNSICPPAQAPVRCSFAAGGGNTGLNNGSGDNSEGSGGNKFVEDIAANVGDVFILLIDNFDASSEPFNLNWSLSNGASLDCTPLPVEFINFSGESVSYGNKLTWTTLSEINNNYFAIERSEDGFNYEKIGSVNGFGNSNSPLEYSFIDNNVQSNYYYRLKQVDYNGDYEFSNSIYIGNNFKNEFRLFPNPSNGILSLNLGNTDYAHPIIIRYVNVIGEAIEENLPISEGTNQYRLDKFQNLKSGIYFVKILDELGNTIKIDKIVKQ